MTQVQGVLTDASGTPLSGVAVTVLLGGVSNGQFFPATGHATSGLIVKAATVTTDSTGTWTVTLVPNGSITPANTVYQVSQQANSERLWIIVPDSATVQQVEALLVSQPQSLDVTAAQLAINTAASIQPGKPGGVATLDSNSLVPVAQIPNLSGTYAPVARLVNPRAAANVTQGLYARATPTPSGETAGILPLCRDPNQSGVHGTGRLWAYGLTSGMIGYTDDDGTTFTTVSALPAGSAGLSPCQMEITSGVVGGDFAFLLCNSSVANQGGLWRSPAPAASPALTWSIVQANDATNNVANGPGATATHTADGSNYRNQCFAIKPDGSQAALVSYAAGSVAVTWPNRTGNMGAGSDLIYLPGGGMKGAQHGLTATIPGAGVAGASLTGTIQRIYGDFKAELDVCASTTVIGASIAFAGNPAPMDLSGGAWVRICTNPCAANPATVSWTITKFWELARHAHACRYINGILWANLGDYPFPVDYYGEPPITHVGLWAATSSASTSFTQVMGPINIHQGDGINFLPVTVGGQPMIAMETDSLGGNGVMIFPSQDPTTRRVQVPSLRTQLPVITTGRCLAVTAQGNLIWYATGEGGGVGPVDAIMMAAPPFDSPVVLEQLAPGTATDPLNAVVSNGYVWMGNLRIAPDRFLGQ